jgi:hypothetical protein
MKQGGTMKLALIRLAGTIYLPAYDAAMRLGPKRGPVALGYGPLALAVAAFLLKARLLDPWMDPVSATWVIFIAFALTGPLMHVGTKILAERMTRASKGVWPGSADPRFDRLGKLSPTEHWVSMLREELRGG